MTMKYTTLTLLCCGALISACDNSDDTNKQKESSALEQVSTLASEESAKVLNEMDKAAEATKDSAESMAESAGKTAAKASAAVSSASSDEAAKGEEIYTKKCSTCHGSGVAGSPKLGDKAAWGARISQGEAIMIRHAIEGFKGDTGYMPAKGGFTSLSDAEVAAAVKYMAAKAE